MAAGPSLVLSCMTRTLPPPLMALVEVGVYWHCDASTKLVSDFRIALACLEDLHTLAKCPTLPQELQFNERAKQFSALCLAR